MLARHNSHGRLSPYRNLIDILRSYLGFNDERIAARHNLHDRFARFDNSAHRMYRQLQDGARLWGANVHSPELVLGRRDTFGEFGDLALGLPQILQYVTAKVLIELQYLQLRFTDLSLCTRNVRNILAPLAF